MKYLMLFLLLIIPMTLYAEWSQPEWTDDCTTIVTKDVQNRMSTWTEQCYDQDGKLVRKRVDTYTYYPTGEIKDIEEKVLNGKDTVLSDKTVTHYTDVKKPPTVINKDIRAVEVGK